MWNIYWVPKLIILWRKQAKYLFIIPKIPTSIKQLANTSCCCGWSGGWTRANFGTNSGASADSLDEVITGIFSFWSEEKWAALLQIEQKICRISSKALTVERSDLLHQGICEWQSDILLILLSTVFKHFQIPNQLLFFYQSHVSIFSMVFLVWKWLEIRGPYL